MKRRLLYGTLVVLLGLNGLVGAQLYLNASQASDSDDAYSSLKLFTTVMERIRSEYVDNTKISYRDLVQAALKGMLGTLDPHSEFMDQSKYQDLKNDTSGEFGGVGIAVSKRGDYLTVDSPIEDTPGFKAGILAEDRIVKIDGKSTDRMSFPEAVKLLRGEPGTDVTLTIVRPPGEDTQDYRLTRAVIKVDTVKDLNGKREFPIGDQGIGYVRLTQFGERTAEELGEALKKLKDRGMKGLVMDLRGNPGGLLDQAVEVCEKFLPRGELVVTTEGREGKQKSEYRARGGEKYGNLPVVILVNGGSASASEIVSGCLQDTAAKGLCRVVILGEQTFGKGSVQSILQLQDGSALRLTTAKYFTPSHKVIHEKGITPDVVVPMSDQEELDVYRKRSPGALKELPVAERERILNAHDVQLDRAVDLLKGLTTYSTFKTGVPDPAVDKKPAKVAQRPE